MLLKVNIINISRSPYKIENKLVAWKQIRSVCEDLKATFINYLLKQIKFTESYLNLS